MFSVISYISCCYVVVFLNFCSLLFCPVCFFGSFFGCLLSIWSTIALLGMLVCFPCVVVGVMFSLA